MGTKEELRDLLAFCDQAGIRPAIGTELPFKEAEQGFRTMLDGETAGKIVFVR
jgi:D-arabinose 1-dehydrogenase-like Zn-dependent alcohol dehydrogenase